MEQKRVIDLVKSVAAKKKTKWTSSQFSAYNKSQTKKAEYPDYYSTYALAVELAEANRYHAEKGVFPANLFLAKSPYQTDAELAYIRENYKQITLPIAVDFINTLSRAFNEGNYSIKYREDEPKYKDNTLQAYLEKDIETYGSLENFFKFLFPTIKIIDANGVIAIKPYFTLVKNEEGGMEVSSTELNEPQPIYYDCSKVVAYKEEEYCLIDVTNYNQKSAPTLYYYELYDTENIWQITYDTKLDKEKAIKVNLYYNHALSWLPTTKIKGIPRPIDGGFIWQSVFSFATDILDIIAIDNSTLNISKQKTAYPVRVYEGKPCAFNYTDGAGQVSLCDGGLVWDSTSERKINCPACHGIGLVDRFSPLHDFITAPDSKLENGSTGNKVPFQYVAPSAEILVFLENSIAKNEERARKILHIQNSNAVIKGTENLTATGMALGDKSTSAFIKPISDQMFDTWEFVIDIIGKMRYGADYKKPVIEKPKTFDFNTEYDYMLEISTAINAGLPPVMIQAIIYRYLKSHFFKEETTMKALQLIIDADRLIGVSNEDILIGMSKGVVSGWEKILHDSGLSLINQLVGATPKFFEQKPQKQKEDLIAKAKEIESANKPQTNTQGAISDVLSAGGQADDSLGKLPLALQQLGLAVQRADEAGNKALSKRLQDKMTELVKEIEVS